MKELSRTQELRIISAAERMVDLANGGIAPNDALYKVATEEKLTPEFVKRLAEVYNTSRMLHHFQVASPEKRADEFPLAAAADVLDRMYPKKAEDADNVKAASASQHSTWFAPPPNFCAPPLEKAALQTASKITPSSDVSVDILVKRARNHAASLCRSAEVARADEQYFREMVRSAVVKAAQYFCALDHTPFSRVETDLLSQYGETARPLLNAVFIGCKGASRGEKRGSASDSQRIFDREVEPYNHLTSAFRLAAQWHKAAQEAAAIEAEHTEFNGLLNSRLRKLANCCVETPSFPFDDIAKRAGVLPALASTTFIGSKLNDMLGDDESPQRFEQQVRQSVDPSQEASIRAVRAKSMLHEMMTNDPVISGYDPDQVMEAFNEISQMTPRVAEQPALLRGLIARRLEMGRTEPFEASQVIDAETGLKRIDEPSKPMSVY